MTFDVEGFRAQFPALTRVVGDRTAAFLDGPGGTQVPESVIAAMASYQRSGISNLGAPYVTGDIAQAVVDGARSAVADLLGSASEEVVFGPNMTTLTFAVSRAIGQEWGPGENLVVTRLDHDANVTPWIRVAFERGVEVRTVDFDTETGRLDMGQLESMVDDHTRLVAVGYASNALGTVNPVEDVVAIAASHGALSYVDAVHYAAHGRIDVQEIGCDFLVVSPYKFFGPHSGVLYGRFELLEKFEAYKVRPAPDLSPGKWETGTSSFEALAGITAAVDYLAGLGGTEGDRRSRLDAAFDAIGRYEASLADRFLSQVAGSDAVGLFGPQTGAGRVPTFALDVKGQEPAHVAAALGKQGLFVWSGDYYAVSIMERLGRQDRGGLVRVGFVHYNTIEEVEAVMEAMAGLGG